MPQRNEMTRPKGTTKPIEERKVKTCVRVKPATLQWYKILRIEKKISMGQILEDYKVNNEKEK